MSESDDISSTAQFTVREDPALSMTKGDRLRFEYVTPHFEGAPRSGHVENWQMTEGILLAVMSSGDSFHSVLGSATMVAPGVALTATHNLESLIPEWRSGTLKLMCFGIASHGAQAWNIKLVTCVELNDVCILGLEYACEIPPTRTFYQATITTRAPGQGELVTMVGFRAASNSFERRDDDVADVGAGMLISSGVVTKRYLQGRDRVKIPWPTLEVDCPTVGGMSGGAVFDSRGFLVGLITSSIEGGPEAEPAPTYAALLWSILGQKFPGGWPVALMGGELQSLLDLNGRRLCRIEQPSAVEVSFKDGRVITNYAPWT